MSRPSQRQTSQTRTHSWVDAIPLGSLEQLQNNASGEPTDTGRVAAGSASGSQGLLESRSAHDLPPEQVALPSSRPSPAVSEPAGDTPASRSRLRSSGVHDADPEQIALPLSRQPSGTSESGGSGDVSAQNDSASGLPSQPARIGSLQQLENVIGAALVDGQVPVVAVSDPTAHAAAQTNAGPASSAVNGQLAVPEQHLNYWAKLLPLVECLPHLEILPFDHKSRYPSIGSLVCLDYSEGTARPSRYKNWTHNRFSRGSPRWSAKVQQLKTDVPADIPTVVILVEDLSEQLIEALGSKFNIDPDFFAEHLANASHYKCDHDEKFPKPPVAPMSKPCYASLKWIRPVRQNPKLSEWLSKPEMLLDERTVLSKQGQKSKIERGVSWADTETETVHRVTADSNIFRRSWTLSSASPSGLNRLQNDDPSSDWSANAVSTAWVERATVYNCDEGQTRFVIILLDPLPSLTDQSRSTTLTSQVGRSRQITTDEVANIPCFKPVAPRSSLSLPSNKLEATAGDIAQFRESMEKVTPTVEAMQHWTLETTPDLPNASRYDPFLALFEIVRADTKAFVHALDTALEQIGRDSLDDYLMERRLAEWRRMMSDLQAELPSVQSSIQEMVSYLSSVQGSDTLEPIRVIASELNEDLAGLKRRIDEIYAALRVDMQFSESRRSIMEAKTVTRLTELAFIFIPLSFVSSLFSMSVKELENGVPIWIFVLTALAFASLAYGVRFIVTNDFIADSSRRALERFWARRNVTRGASIPTTTFILLTAQEIWSHGGSDIATTCLGLGFMSSFVVVPVGFMWASTGMDTGFKVSLTLLLVLSGVGVALFTAIMGGPRMSSLRLGFHRRNSESTSESEGQDV